MDYLLCTLIIGVGATALMDLWGIARQPLLGISSPDYGLVGRWLGWMLRGRFHHDAIAVSPAVRGERLIGWSAHYLIGIAFAALLLVARGVSWTRHPTLIPALLVGITTVAAPFLLMQPGMGAGIAAWRTPRPGAVRLQSLITHTIFGLGLYCAGWVAHFLDTPSA
jgi:hypothetical protein